MRFPTIASRALCVFALAASSILVASPANAVTSGLAVDYTDIWYAAGEDGWGINLVQSDTFIYGTFFIFGSDKKPTWVTATLSWDANSNKYTGPVYAYQGSYFGGPWSAADHVESTVGTASFTPDTSSTSLGTMTYTVSGAGPITKSLQRLTLTTIPIAGNYIGGQVGTYTSCASSSSNMIYSDTFQLKISQSAGIANMVFSYNGLNQSCTFSGTLTQTASNHAISSATYKCDDGLNTAAVMSDVKITAQGIEGRFSAPNVGGSCREDARFSAVLD